jgi:hypothetical protein
VRMDDTVFEPPTFGGSKTTTTTKARVDEDVARIDQLRSDEVGPTTCSRLRILNEYETEEVRRHVQHEAIYAAAQARVADEVEHLWSAIRQTSIRQFYFWVLSNQNRT